MGKAGIMKGKKGDIMVPTAHMLRAHLIIILFTTIYRQKTLATQIFQP